MAAAHRPYLTFTLFALLCAVFAIELAFGVAPPEKPMTPALETLIAMGGLNRTLVLKGEVFRLVTAIFLHADLAHLAGNSIVLLLAGWLLERLIGWKRLLIVFCFCGLAGSAGSLVWNSEVMVAAGASGAILGVLFAALVCTHRLPEGANRLRIRIWLLLILALALFPVPVSAGKGLTIDLGAHMAGSLAGIVAGLWLIATWPADRRGQRRWAGPFRRASLYSAEPRSGAPCTTQMGVTALYRGDAAILSKDYGRADQEYSEAIRRTPENRPISAAGWRFKKLDGWTMPSQITRQRLRLRLKPAFSSSLLANSIRLQAIRRKPPVT